MTHKERLERKRQLMEFIRDNPEMTFREIGEAFGAPAGTVGFLSRKMGLVRYRNTLAGMSQALEAKAAGGASVTQPGGPTPEH